MTICLTDAACRVQQAQAVLSVWLENSKNEYEANLVASIITLLDGVDAAVEHADNNSLQKK